MIAPRPFLLPLLALALAGCAGAPARESLTIEPPLATPPPNEAATVPQIPREHTTTYCVGDYCPRYTIHQDGQVSLVEEICADGNCWDIDERGNGALDSFSAERDCHAAGKIEGSLASGSVRCRYERLGSVVQRDGRTYISFPFAEAPVLEPLVRQQDGTFVAAEELTPSSASVRRE
jgi:hypothetical protein